MMIFSTVYTWIILFITFLISGTSAIYLIPKTTLTLVAQPNVSSFTSPNYPNAYADAASYTWTIVANQTVPWIIDPIIRLKVVDSVLENTFTCYHDKVEIFDGPSTSYYSVADFCGTSYPNNVITSTYDTVTVTFNADGTKNNFKGFKMEYWIVQKTYTAWSPVVLSTLNYVLYGLAGLIALAFLVVLGYVAMKRLATHIKVQFDCSFSW